MSENRVPTPSTAQWRTPGYQVVETSLEVTMYSSAKR